MSFFRAYFVAIAVGVLTVTGCSWLPENRHAYSDCAEDIRKSFRDAPTIAMTVKSTDLREQLIIVSTTNTHSLTLTGLNSLGAKRFTYQLVGSDPTIEAGPFSNKKHIRALMGSLSLAQLYLQGDSSAHCQASINKQGQLLLNGVKTSISELKIAGRRATFNISDLGYNVALLYLENGQ